MLLVLIDCLRLEILKDYKIPGSVITRFWQLRGKHCGFQRQVKLLLLGFDHKIQQSVSMVSCGVTIHVVVIHICWY